MIARSRLRAAPRSGTDEALVWLAIGCVGVALAARRVGEVGLMVTLLAGAIGLLLPAVQIRRSERLDPARSAWPAVLLVGAAAFAAARWMVLLPPQPVAGFALAGNVLAGFAEEAFFRRLLFGRLLRWGPVVAVVGSAVAFAAVHLPAYGSWAFVVDLAAGLVLGWQRWAGRTWLVPGVTHAMANVLQMI